MSRSRCSCGSPKLWYADYCFTCDAWFRRQAAGSAPEHKRAPARHGRTKGEGSGVANSHQNTPSLAGAQLRHPTSDYCFLHEADDKWTCPRCIENGERDYEEAEL